LVRRSFAAFVLLVGQRLPLDLELHDLALDFVDLLRQRIRFFAMRSRAAASSIRSIALSGRKRP